MARFIRPDCSKEQKVTLLEDDDGAIHPVSNPMVSTRPNHVGIPHHFIRRALRVNGERSYYYSCGVKAPTCSIPTRDLPLELFSGRHRYLAALKKGA